MKALLYKNQIVFRWVLLIVPVSLALQIALLVPRVGWKLEYILGMPTVVLVVTGIFSGIGTQITSMRFQVDRYLQSVPIKKTLVILKRYPWFWIIGMVASVLISVALYLGGVPALAVSLVAVSYLFATTFFPTLLTPCIYLLGSEKASIPLMIIFMILEFGMSIGSNSLSDAGKAQLLAVLAGKIDLIVGGLLVSTIDSNVGSYFASSAIYQHKVNWVNLGGLRNHPKSSVTGENLRGKSGLYRITASS